MSLNEACEESRRAALLTNPRDGKFKFKIEAFNKAKRRAEDCEEKPRPGKQHLRPPFQCLSRDLMAEGQILKISNLTPSRLEKDSASPVEGSGGSFMSARVARPSLT